jgi:hypothetical protein
MSKLLKSSISSEVKLYFEEICSLQVSGKEFPVSLDDVWPLAYVSKHKAVEALKNNGLFEQDSDYKVFTRLGENPKGGRPTNDYYLSVPCLEYFIARKNRKIFEIYRQVFHRAMNPQSMSKADAIIDTVQHIMSLPLDNEAKTELIQRINNDGIRALPEGKGLTLPPAAGDGMISATRLLRKHGVTINVEYFNDVLCSIGYMERVNAGWRSYCVLIDEGLKYGRNKPNPYYRGRTMPVYSEDTFEELLNVVFSCIDFE